MAFRGRADIGRASDKDGVTEHRQIVISDSDSRVSSGGDVAGDRRETLRELRGCASLNVYTIESGSALRTNNQSVSIVGQKQIAHIPTHNPGSYCPTNLPPPSFISHSYLCRKMTCSVAGWSSLVKEVGDEDNPETGMIM